MSKQNKLKSIKTIKNIYYTHFRGQYLGDNFIGVYWNVSILNISYLKKCILCLLKLAIFIELFKTRIRMSLKYCPL